MTESLTQILETKVESVGVDTYRVEMVLADKANAEEATEAIRVSVRVQSKFPSPFLAELQVEALHRAVQLIREHIQPLDQMVEQGRR